MIGTVSSGWTQKVSGESPLVDVDRATVIAFFVPSPETQSKDADENEALIDFQLYASSVKKPLAKAGIRFEELYSNFFRVRVGGKTETFHPTTSVGYCFVAPGKSPHVEYGVMTDSDLLLVAKRYFGLTKVPN